MLKVKEPKVLVIRSPDKSRDLKEQLKGKLREAYDQLRTVRGCRKVIYVDTSGVAGKIVLQLPELMRYASRTEIVAS